MSVHELLWYLPTPRLLFHEHLSYKHSRKQAACITLNYQMKEIYKWNTPLIISMAKG